MRRSRRWCAVRYVLFPLLVLMLAVGTVGFLQYRRQIASYLTHWKGSPTHTGRIGPFAPAPPHLHVAVAGDIGDSGAASTRTAHAMAGARARRPVRRAAAARRQRVPDGDPARLPMRPCSSRSRRCSIRARAARDPRQPRREGRHTARRRCGRSACRAGGGRRDRRRPARRTRLERPDDPNSYAWLEDARHDARRRWKIVALHHPPYSAGYQGSSNDAREGFAPIFERYGVQLVLSGHDHDYQRSKPINGVTYVVSGAAAGTRRTGEATSPPSRSRGTTSSTWPCSTTASCCGP